MSGEVQRAFETVLDIMNMTLVPYGNANVSYIQEYDKKL